ncbi:MAG: LytR/AlgR family response regulator transcription factor [Nitritalea sp.]
MKILLIEDEPLAAKRLQQLISKLRPEAEFCGLAQSNEEFDQLLSAHTEIDLIFCDIHLADGHSFHTLRKHRLLTPIIFVTAYDQHALEAFEHYCIDYLLKPIEERKLIRALDKFAPIVRQKAVSASENAIADPEQLKQMIQEVLAPPPPTYKSRFLVHVGKKMHFVWAQDVSFFHSKAGITYLVTRDGGQRYLVDESLSELEKNLDPAVFYRISRNTIVHIGALNVISPFENGRLKIGVGTADGEQLVVSRERVSGFKNWVNQ